MTTPAAPSVIGGAAVGLHLPPLSPLNGQHIFSKSAQPVDLVCDELVRGRAIEVLRSPTYQARADMVHFRSYV